MVLYKQKGSEAYVDVFRLFIDPSPLWFKLKYLNYDFFLGDTFIESHDEFGYVDYTFHVGDYMIFDGKIILKHRYTKEEFEKDFEIVNQDLEI